MQVVLGAILHFIGGFASGSFYVPFKKVKKWHWESYWIIGGLFSWLIVPPLAAWITVPDFAKIISETSASTFWWTYSWGILWGIGGLMYGLGMRYLGLSLGNSVLLGFTSAFGALVPAIYYNFVSTPGKQLLMISSIPRGAGSFLLELLFALSASSYADMPVCSKKKNCPKKKRKTV